MKKFFLLITSLCFLKKIEGQTAQSVFETDHLYYYGLDFSNARFSGFEGEISPLKLRDSLFLSWNLAILEEQDKFSIKGALRKKKLYKILSVTERKNNTADPAKMYVERSSKYVLSPEAIQEMIRSYNDTIRKEGIGLVFIVEYFSRPAHRSSIYVTFYDNATKDVLLSKHMVSEPYGFGLRNYWAHSVKAMIQEIYSTEFLRWKQQAYKSGK